MSSVLAGASFQAGNPDKMEVWSFKINFLTVATFVLVHSPAGGKDSLFPQQSAVSVTDAVSKTNKLLGTRTDQHDR